MRTWLSFFYGPPVDYVSLEQVSQDLYEKCSHIQKTNKTRTTETERTSLNRLCAASRGMKLLASSKNYSVAEMKVLHGNIEEEMMTSSPKWTSLQGDHERMLLWFKKHGYN